MFKKGLLVNISNQFSIENHKECSGIQQEKPSNIEGALPPELLVAIFSHLNREDLLQTSLVNYRWQQASVTAAQQGERSKIVEFTKFLIKSLQEEIDKNQVEKLLTIASETSISDAVNLSQIKVWTDSYRETILDLLESLEEDLLERLEQLSKTKAMHCFFEEMLDEAKVYKKIEKIVQISREPLQRDQIQSLLLELIEKRCVNIAFNAIDKIPSPANRSFATNFLIRHLGQRGSFHQAIIDRAIHTVCRMENVYRSQPLFLITRCAVENGTFTQQVFNRVIEATQELNETYRFDILRFTAEMVAKNSHLYGEIFDKIIDLTHKLNSFHRVNFFEHTICCLARNNSFDSDRVDRVIKAIHKFDDHFSKVEVLKYIVRYSVKNSLFSKRVIFDREVIDKVIEETHQFSQDCDRVYLFESIVECLTKNGNIDGNIKEVIGQITKAANELDGTHRSQILSDILQRLAKNSSIDRDVKEVISKITQAAHELDDTYKSQIFQYTLELFIENENFDEEITSRVIEFAQIELSNLLKR